MFKNKCVIFIIPILALLLMNIVSAEEESSLEITGTDMTVSTTLMNDTCTEDLTSEYEEETNLDMASKDDSGGLKPQTDDNENTLGAKSSNNDETTFSENNLIKNSNNELILKDEPLVGAGEENSAIYVDPEKGNDNNTGDSWATAVKTIDKAMNKTSANGKIYLADGTHELTKKIDIKMSVTIIGNGTNTVVTSNKQSRVFSITVGGVAIYNCTFKDNSIMNDGGVIKNVAAKLTISGCTFIGNSASGNSNGGVIYNTAAGLTVNNCTFIGNSARYGGAIYNTGANVIISNCTFINNTVGGKSNGGAIYSTASGFVVNKSVFIGNKAGYGGAIYNAADNNNYLTVGNSTFVGNTATTSGNAISTKNKNICIANDNWWGINDPNW